MTWNELEKTFQSAMNGIFSQKKLLTAFAALSLSGLFFIFCKALSLTANSWMKLSLLFLPALLAPIFFLMFGSLLVQMYERKKECLALGRLASVAMKTTQLTFPPLLAYLCLWLLLGVFFLLKEIPFIGPLFNIIFAFGPFLFIVCSIVLCILNFALLFFMVPWISKVSMSHFYEIEFGRRIWASIKTRPFLSGALFLVAILPALSIGTILTLAAVLTDVSFSLDGAPFALALEWFFVMLPFSALLSPAIVFFFQFAAESHQHLRKI